MKNKRLVFLAFLALAGLGLGRKKIQEGSQEMTLTLTNATKEAFDISLGTNWTDQTLDHLGLSPGEKADFLLTDLPLGPHTAVVAKFKPQGRDEAFRRHLIYDLDATPGPYKGLIVDYGDRIIDVKMVRR